MTDLKNSLMGKKSMNLFFEGYNCSQSVLGAWSERLGIDFKTAVTISSGFGGGMGRMREVCGACSGAFMVLSLKYGNYEPKDYSKKKELYEIIQRFAIRFKEENNFNSIICHEMLGLSSGTDNPAPSERTETYYKKRPCPELVCLASALLEEFI